eukprot:jgi/Mesen1/9325/ME000061S08765
MPALQAYSLLLPSAILKLHPLRRAVASLQSVGCYKTCTGSASVLKERKSVLIHRLQLSAVGKPSLSNKFEGISKISRGGRATSHSSGYLERKRSCRAMASMVVVTPEKNTVAVIGAGIAGLVCATTLVERGAQVAVFDMGRGPGGRMSTRRERREEGSADLVFDHGAQYFTVKDPLVQSLVDKWQLAEAVDQWRGRFGTLDASTGSFAAEEEEGKRRYVGKPGMNAICQSLAAQPGVETRYGVMVKTLKWNNGGSSSSGAGAADGQWELRSSEGAPLGAFDAVVLAAAYKTFQVDVEGEAEQLEDLLTAVRGVEAFPCFAVMLSFTTPLTEVPFDGALVTGSERVSWVARDSSKPGRLPAGASRESDLPECWVVHSTAEYARGVISKAPPGRPSPELLASVCEELLSAFQEAVPGVPTPSFMRAHRWGGAFPVAAAAPDQKVLLNEAHRLAACGDFCVSARVEGAIQSGLAAADSISRILKADAKL